MTWARGRFITSWPQPQGPVVYFLAVGGMVKIGRASNLLRRLSDLMMASAAPLLLEGWLPGHSGLEAALHNEFKTARSHGEWFRRTPTLSGFLNRLQNCIDSDAARRDFAAKFFLDWSPVQRGRATP
jgi:hypothetical protein